MYRFILLFFPIFLSAVDLTLDQKVGQLLMVHFNGTTANADAKRLIEEAYVGSFIYYSWSNGLESPEQVRALSEGLQKLSPQIPLLIAVDQEGGRVTRLQHGFSQPPPNGWLCQQGYPNKAERWAETVGSELRAVGVNMNLAPVVDVNSNPKNPVIGDRSFSHEPWEVVRFAQAALRGYRRARVIAVLKHFPGHGDTDTDSHFSLPVVRKKREELEHVELLPFRRLLPEAKAVMTAHLMVPALDEKRCASLSSRIIKDLLRNEYGFDGVVMCDSLVMQGVLDCCPSIEEAAIQAIEAGNDIIILGGKQLVEERKGLELSVEQTIAVHHAIVSAVKQGRLSEEAIDASVRRIMKLKKSPLF